MNCDNVQQRLTLYLLGDLGPAEQRQVEAHVAACDVCRAHVQDLQTTLDLLSGALADAKAGEELALSREARLRVMATRPGALISWPWVFGRHPGLALAASVVIVAGLTWAVVGHLRPVRPEPAHRVTRESVERAPAARDDVVARRNDGSAVGYKKVPAQTPSPVAAPSANRKKELPDRAAAVEGGDVPADRADLPVKPDASFARPAPVMPPATALPTAPGLHVGAAPSVSSVREEGRAEAPQAALGVDQRLSVARRVRAADEFASAAPGAAPETELAVAKADTAGQEVPAAVRPFAAPEPAPEPVLDVVAPSGGAPLSAAVGEADAARGLHAGSGKGDEKAAAPGDAPVAGSYEKVRRSLAEQVWPPREVVGEGALQNVFQRGDGEYREVMATVARLEDLLRRGPAGATAQELETVADELEALALDRGDEPRLRDLARMARAAAALIRVK